MLHLNTLKPRANGPTPSLREPQYPPSGGVGRAQKRGVGLSYSSWWPHHRVYAKRRKNPFCATTYAAHNSVNSHIYENQTSQPNPRSFRPAQR